MRFLSIISEKFRGKIDDLKKFPKKFVSINTSISDKCLTICGRDAQSESQNPVPSHNRLYSPLSLMIVQ